MKLIALIETKNIKEHFNLLTNKIMGIISTRTHGMIDYITGVALILAPWLFQFADGGPATWIPVALGIAIIVYSLLTDYELGLVGMISMTAHLWLDGLGGLFLALSPWLYDFAGYVYLPHVIIGLAEVGMALMTHTRSGVDYRDRRSAI